LRKGSNADAPHFHIPREEPAMRVTCAADDELESTLLAEPVGRLDIHGATALLESVHPRLSGDWRSLIIDMREVDYVTSAGIDTLIRLLTRAKQLGGGVTVFGCNPGVRQVLRVVSIETLLNVRESVEESREHLREAGLG
jgi:anti-anti-sigma factor